MKFTTRQLFLATLAIAVFLAAPSLYRGVIFLIPKPRLWSHSMIRVIDEETLEPVPDIRVSLTLIGDYGGDGGSDPYQTDEYGTVRFSYRGPAMFQVRLEPAKDSIYEWTDYHSSHDMLWVREDGSYFPAQFRLRRK